MKIVVGFPAGAALDLMTRLVAENMRSGLGRPIIVENRAGAGGIVANEAVKSAAPDGATLLMTPGCDDGDLPALVRRHPALRPASRFRAGRAHVDLPDRIWRQRGRTGAGPCEYVALIKRSESRVPVGHPGSIPHFLGVMFARAAGIEMTHVPYKGTAPAMQAIATGEITAVGRVSSPT